METAPIAPSASSTSLASTANTAKGGGGEEEEEVNLEVSHYSPSPLIFCEQAGLIRCVSCRFAQYLRNVILQFLEHKEMRANLVRVLSVILHFTPQETRRLVAGVS